MGKKIDLTTGQVFGRLTVLEEAGRNKHGQMLWKCRCSCGNEVIVRVDSLRSGHTTSCGCYHIECHTTHGMRKTRLYGIWFGILTRTGTRKGANERHKREYQDRGITLCKQWKFFENFRDWSLTHGYYDDLEIDRIDNDKGYAPDNCRWVTRKENINNRRNTLRLGDGTSLAMFCSEIGIKTFENGKTSKQYDRIQAAYRRYHKAHPDLIAKANDLVSLYSKCLRMLELLDDVRAFREQLQASMLSNSRE